MFGLFSTKKKANGVHNDEAAKAQAVDSAVRVAQKQAEDLIKELRRSRERRMLKEALGGDN